MHTEICLSISCVKNAEYIDLIAFGNEIVKRFQAVAEGMAWVAVSEVWVDRFFASFNS